mmetsp:Transcript_21998/g.46804  ORF Transcript_21998/g.46804 Transcript_21998/m.46804 type:complete len:465 (-) Transcript_21998:134-1528(-)
MLRPGLRLPSGGLGGLGLGLHLGSLSGLRLCHLPHCILGIEEAPLLGGFLGLGYSFVEGLLLGCGDDVSSQHRPDTHLFVHTDLLPALLQGDAGLLLRRGAMLYSLSVGVLGSGLSTSLVGCSCCCAGLGGRGHLCLGLGLIDGPCLLSCRGRGLTRGRDLRSGRLRRSLLRRGGGLFGSLCSGIARLGHRDLDAIYLALAGGFRVGGGLSAGLCSLSGLRSLFGLSCGCFRLLLRRRDVLRFLGNTGLLHMSRNRGRVAGLCCGLLSRLLGGIDCSRVRLRSCGLGDHRCQGDLHSDAGLAVHLELPHTFRLVPFLARLAVVLGLALRTSGREGLGVARVRSLRGVAVLGALNGPADEPILAHLMVVLCREEAALIAPRSLRHALPHPPVPEGAQVAEAMLHLLQFRDALLHHLHRDVGICLGRRGQLPSRGCQGGSRPEVGRTPQGAAPTLGAQALSDGAGE